MSDRGISRASPSTFSAAISGQANKGVLDAEPYLKLHIEPGRPIEVSTLTHALGSLSRQYQGFILDQGLFDKAGEARLLVSSVSQGSIDIRFLIDLASAAQLPVLLPVLIDKADLLIKFAEKVKRVLDFFLGDEKGEPTNITIRDCDDAANIVGPIAEAGGTQNITVIKGDVNVNVLQIDADKARKIVERSTAVRASLAAPNSESKQRVSLVWTQLAKDAAKTDGKRSPDKGVIAEVDTKAHAVLFTDEMAYLKKEMIDDEENPLQKVYFIDVEISRLPDGRPSAYRVIGYHGKDDI